MITTEILRTERTRLVQQFSAIEKNLEQHRGAILTIDKLISDAEKSAAEFEKSLTELEKPAPEKTE